MIRASALALSILVVAYDGHGENGNTACGMAIDTFTDCVERGTLPCGWRPSRNDVSMFSVTAEAGNYFLRVDTRGGATTLVKEFAFDPDEYPLLRWRWRVHQLPDRAREDVRRRADSGAGVYVIFARRLFRRRMIKYVWSSTLDSGTVTESPYNGNVKVMVLRSGVEGTGRWVTEQVDVRRDYLELFGESEVEEVVAIGVMSDSDNTNSWAKADYDDFCVSTIQ